MTGKSAFYLPVLLVFIAMEVIFAFSAFGFITIPPISITSLPALVLAGAFVLGPLAGAILGGIFGLASIWKASVSAVAHADQIFSPFISGNPLASLILSLGVRVLFGFVAGCLFFCRKNIQKKWRRKRKKLKKKGLKTLKVVIMLPHLQAMLNNIV